MLTFADTEHPPVISAIEDAKFPCTTFYKFNNSALFENDNSDMKLWQMSNESFCKFFGVFARTAGVSVCSTREVLRHRKQLEDVSQSVQSWISSRVGKLKELKQQEEVLIQAEVDLKSSQNFTYSVTVTKQRKIDLPSSTFVIYCTSCNYTCEENYHGSKIYESSAMDNGGESGGRCRKCPCKCSWREHALNPFYLELYNESETRTNHELKDKHDKAMKCREDAKQIIQSINSFLRQVEMDIDTMNLKMVKITQHLDEIALWPNPLSHLTFLNALIDSEKQQSRPGFTQRIKSYEQAKQQVSIIEKAKELASEDVSSDDHPDSPDDGDSNLPWYKRLQFLYN